MGGREVTSAHEEKLIILKGKVGETKRKKFKTNLNHKKGSESDGKNDSKEEYFLDPSLKELMDESLLLFDKTRTQINY